LKKAVASGIKDVILITGWHKRAIEDHFDRSGELEKFLRDQNKTKDFGWHSKDRQSCQFHLYPAKTAQYGNALAVMAARPVIGNEPFAVMWGDEFISANPPRLKQIIDVHKNMAAS